MDMVFFLVVTNGMFFKLRFFLVIAVSEKKVTRNDGEILASDGLTTKGNYTL
jgi:hypothetical protein